MNKSNQLYRRKIVKLVYGIQGDTIDRVRNRLITDSLLPLGIIAICYQFTHIWYMIDIYGTITN